MSTEVPAKVWYDPNTGRLQVTITGGARRRTDIKHVTVLFQWPSGSYDETRIDRRPHDDSTCPARAERDQLRDRLTSTREVADEWRRYALTHRDEHDPVWAGMAHGMCCVLAAIDGVPPDAGAVVPNVPSATPDRETETRP